MKNKNVGLNSTFIVILLQNIGSKLNSTFQNNKNCLLVTKKNFIYYLSTSN